MSQHKRKIHAEGRNQLSYQFYPLLAGGIGCVCCLLWSVLVYDDPASHPWINVTEKEYIISSLAQQVHVRTPTFSTYIVSASGFIRVSSSKQSLPVKAMVRSLPLWSMCFCSFGHQWLVNILMVYTPTYISSVFHVNIRDNGFLSALPFAVAWVVGILGGYLADFLLTKNFRLVTVRKIATVLGSLPSSVFLMALPYLTSSYITTIILLTLSCGLTPLCQSGVYINALDIAPSHTWKRAEEYCQASLDLAWNIPVTHRHSSFLMGASRGFAHIAAVLTPTVSGFLLSQDPENGWRNVFLLLLAIDLSVLIFYLIFGEADVQDWAKERKLTHL
ncbi:hypothetical protein HPG69_008787 [Diceros bicornis minor]|uniref:Uncharacterized protein n=1 Tax=Diceros bicornis minor TaxID=77932 RepID=A0A7J7FAR9_DICBM|nr:hypothetical protein HPG69_008787 [Diceros bicornis minor]